MKISVNDLVLKATINSLINNPKWNSSFDGDKLIMHPSINLGIAIALEQGLIVPAVMDSQNLDLVNLSIQAKDLGARARGNGNPLSNAELTKGTFSTSNLGMFGVDRFDAILPPGTGAILAVAASKQNVVAGKDGSIAVKRQMQVNLTADHRVIYGADGAAFLKDLASLIEDHPEDLAS